MHIEFFPWPYAVRSYGYYPPEANVQVPTDVFQRMLNDASKEKWPEWWATPINDGSDFTLMQARTFYGLVGDNLQPWLTERAEQDIEDRADKAFGPRS